VLNQPSTGSGSKGRFCNIQQYNATVALLYATVALKPSSAWP